MNEVKGWSRSGCDFPERDMETGTVTGSVGRPSSGKSLPKMTCDLSREQHIFAQMSGGVTGLHTDTFSHKITVNQEDRILQKCSECVEHKQCLFKTELTLEGEWLKHLSQLLDQMRHSNPLLRILPVCDSQSPN